MTIEQQYNQRYWKNRSEKYEQANWVKNKTLLSVLYNYLPRQTRSLIDLGIGTGAIANMVLDKVEQVYGLDISSDMMKGVSHQVVRIQGNIHHLPFKPNTFECVVMRNVLHYLQDKETVIESIYHIIELKGMFIFSQVIPFVDDISKEYDWLIGRNIHYPTLSEIKNLNKAFRIVDIQEVVLPSQSIISWLNITTKTKAEKDTIIKRHLETSDHYKRLVNYTNTGDDILVDIKHVCMKMEKP